MLRILIIDDERPARNRLRRMLADLPMAHVVGEAASGQEALRLIPVMAPDVLLLDISMPGLGGLAIAETLQQQSSAPAVIFCTAWSDKAVKALEVDAVDYLVKPVRAERLEMALEKAKRFISKGRTEAEDSFLRSTLGNKVYLMPLTDLIFLRAEDKYTTAVHINGESVVNQTLLELEKTHADFLVRIHRGVLVAKNRIRGLEKASDGRHYVLLDGCDDHPQVSRRNLAAIRRLIQELT